MNEKVLNTVEFNKIIEQLTDNAMIFVLPKRRQTLRCSSSSGRGM